MSAMWRPFCLGLIMNPVPGEPLGIDLLLIYQIYRSTKGSPFPFYWHGLTLITAWINNHMPRKVWDELIIHSQILTVAPLML